MSKPVDIAGLRKRGVEVPVPFFGEEIAVTYDPITVASPEFRSGWNQMAKKEQHELSEWIRAAGEELKMLPLPDEFPARKQLTAAGIAFLGDVPATTAELQKITGIGPRIALEVVNAMNADTRFDETEFDRRLEMLRARQTLALIRDWDLAEGGEPFPLTADALASIRGLSAAISKAVWEHANSLGNPTSSTATRFNSN